MQRDATRLVTGHCNEIVEWHPDACQHCGFYGVPADSKCSACGIRTHAECVPFAGGLCDACLHAVEAPCALCGREDPSCGRDDATDRMVKKVVYFGRTWTVGTPDGTYELVEDLHGVDLQDFFFMPQDLPHRGARKMAVCVGDATYLSDPVVVHTWCALSLLQLSPRTGDEWVDGVAAALRHPPARHGRAAAGDVAGGATCGTHECVFCGEADGWTTACLYHLSHRAGCRICRDGERAPDKLATSRHFHPSCAVWAGMQRMSRREGFGAVCFGNNRFRANNGRDDVLRDAYRHPSGIHYLLSQAATPQSMSIPEGVTFKGSRYPIRRGRKRATAKGAVHDASRLQRLLSEAFRPSPIDDLERAVERVVADDPPASDDERRRIRASMDRLDAFALPRDASTPPDDGGA